MIFVMGVIPWYVAKQTEYDKLDAQGEGFLFLGYSSQDYHQHRHLETKQKLALPISKVSWRSAEGYLSDSDD